MRIKGKIATWHDDKGYGFVAPLSGDKQVFVHIKAFSNRNRRPQVNDIVSFAVSKDRQGRPCAIQATLAGDKLKEKTAQKSNSFSIVFALGFLVVVGISVLTGRLPEFIGIAYAVLSLIAYFVYLWDKSAAKHGDWRTSESALHFLGLAGGWPGALIAQQTLRHKSKKVEFRRVLWATVLINCGVFVWLLTGGVVLL